VTSNVDAAINLDADSTATTFVPPAVTVPPTAPDPAGYNYTTTVTVYDDLGSEHSLALYFSKDAPTDPATWTVNAFMDGVASTIDIPQMTFPLTPPVPPATTPTPGVLIPPPTVPIVTSPTVMVGGVPTPLLINLDFTGSTMFSGKFGVNSLAQDGFSKGELATLAVTQEGVIQAQYTNGQALDVGQISLTSFINPNGLQSIGDNHWLATSDAGSANTQKANSGVLGLIRAGSVEESNVDLTAELVNLIIAQRAYQANAQTISAQSAILQTLVNIR
jgi:flagellar hook protein FlgE